VDGQNLGLAFRLRFRDLKATMGEEEHIGTL
jgi:hypothetical protein